MIYNEEARNAIRQPTKQEFKRINVYKGGKCVDTNLGVDEFEMIYKFKAPTGSQVMGDIGMVEVVFDYETYLIAYREYNEKVNKFMKEYIDELYVEYADPWFPRESFDIIYTKAYELGHAFGMHDVEINLEELMDLVHNVLKHIKEEE